MAEGTEQVWDVIRSGNLSQVVALFDNPQSDLLALGDQGGNTPLHISAAWGFHDISRFLLRKGARVNAVNIRGFTPLHWAAMNGHDSVCALLLEAKSPIREDMVSDCPLTPSRPYLLTIRVTVEETNPSPSGVCQWTPEYGKFSCDEWSILASPR